MRNWILNKRWIIWLVLLYGFLLTATDLDYTAVFVDEAFHINIGRQLMDGTACPGCPFAAGYVFIHPILAALGDAAGGLEGARMVNVILGLCLVFFIYVTGKVLFSEKIGLLAAALFIFSGQVPYLMQLATYDMTAAFFLGASMMFLALSFNAAKGLRRSSALAAAMIFLLLASMTKFLLPVFVPFVIIYALVKHGFSRGLIFALCVSGILAAVFYFLAPWSPHTEVMGQIQTFRVTTQIPLLTLADWTLRWLALAYLLAVFGMMHEKHGKTAAALTLLSLPIILIHLVTGAERSVNKNVLFALVYLIPASAVGVEKISEVFSMKSPGRGLRIFFVSAVMLVYWAYGINNFMWLRKQYPDVAPMIGFFEKNGFDGMTVVLNGWDADIYSYSLRSKFPNARYLHVTEAFTKDGEGNPTAVPADFVICEDNYYGMMNPCADYRDFIDADYDLAEHFMFELSWGITDARIYGRR